MGLLMDSRSGELVDRGVADEAGILRTSGRITLITFTASMTSLSFLCRSIPTSRDDRMFC
jgi:hypothetical protein